MKTIKLYLAVIIGAIFLFTACQPDEFEKFENPFDIENVDSVDFYTSSTMMIADGHSKLDFLTTVYQYHEYVTPDYVNTPYGIIFETDSIEEFIALKQSRFPESTIKYYYENGTEITTNNLVIETKTVDTVAIYAKVGDVTSAVKKVYVRDKPDENEFETITYNVIFHIVNANNEGKDGSGISHDYLAKTIEQVNRVFSRESNRSANGADTKIRFKLAEVETNGIALKEIGINRVFMDENYAEPYSTEIKDSLFANYVWDYTKYLNIWIYEPALWDQDPTAEAPSVFWDGYDVVPGFESATYIPQGSTQAIGSLEDVGIIIDTKTIYNQNDVIFQQLFGFYFGLFDIYQNWYDVLVNGDVDYCPDTPTHKSYFNSIGKTDLDGNYFISDNIMDPFPSFYKTITLDQARRMRKVIESCPYRQAYTTSK